MRALVCLPTLNENESIRKSIEIIKGIGYDVIVTDGGSSDGTIEIATSIGVEILYRRGKGKGKGFMQGLQYAKENGYEYLIVCDCDMTYPLGAIPSLLENIHQHDMVIAARAFKDISFGRRLVNYALTITMRILYNYKFLDVASGYRVLRVSSFYGRLNQEGFEVEIELCALAVLDKMRIRQIVVPYYPRLGASKIRFWIAFTAWFLIIKLRIRGWFN